MTTIEASDIDAGVLAGFLDEALDALSNVDALFVQLEQLPGDTDIINSIFRPVHSIKGNAPFFGLMKLKTLAHEAESVLAALRSGKLQPSRGLFDLLLAAVDQLRTILVRVREGQSEVGDEGRYRELVELTANTARTATSSKALSPNTQLIEEIFAQLAGWQVSAEQRGVITRLTQLVRDELQMPSSPTLPVGPTSMEPQPSLQTKAAVSPKAEGAKSMRVPEERIDTFLRFVGELIVAQDMLRHFTAKVEAHRARQDLARDIRTINGVIATLGSGLERAIMSIRKLPIRTLLNKAPRLIRDVAASKNKSIDVVVSGEEIEIDKSLLELLDAPITHMSRNAADHGIESAEVRIAAGKSPTGIVTISCEETAKDILITIADDGAGINYEGLTRKAESIGAISPGEQLSEAQVVDLIFMAGVSTAAEVSEISGRGVGMDVVKRNIDAAGGSISVRSAKGEGSSFVLRLPKAVTTQIIQGFLVQIGEIPVVLPIERVHESWLVPSESIVHVVQTGRCVLRNDQTIRFIDLAEFLGESSNQSDSERQLAVTIQVGDTPVALRVDHIVGPRQLVLKPLAEMTNHGRYFLGGALLGDGQVALMLDVLKLVDPLGGKAVH